MAHYTVIYCEKFDVAVSVAAAIGGIFIDKSTTAKFGQTDKYKEKITEIYKKKGYFPVVGEGDPAIAGKKFKVTWGAGHFGELKQAADYNAEWKNWRALPKPFVRKEYEIKLRNTYNKYQWATVKKLFTDKETSEIYSMTDYEREGELIFDYTYRLTASRVPYKRVAIMETTAPKLIEAVANPISYEENEPRVFAAQSRSIADALVGWNMTASETVKHQGKTKKGEKSPIRKVGRVQTPVLNFVYLRDKEIEAFRPSSTWQVKADVADKNGEVFSVERKGDPFGTKEEADEFVKNFKGDKLACAAYITKEELEYAPRPYDTTTLQKEADGKGIGAKETIDALEALYLPSGGKAGYITYPRTDSKYLTDDKKGAEFFRRFDGIKTIPAFAAMLKYTTVHDRYFDSKKVEAHDAIILTGVAPPSEIPANCKKLFTMIAKRMIALTYPPAKLLKVKGGYISQGKEPFVASGTRVLEKGFLEIFPREFAASPPPSEKGDVFKILKMEVHEVKAKPPQKYTTATLLDAMEKCGNKMEDEDDKAALKAAGGIGRPSTRDAIIEGLLKNMYLELKGRSFSITQMGKDLIEGLEVEDVKSPLLTARWEQALDEIARAAPAEAAGKTQRFISDVEGKVGEWVS